jgi:VWFA-related protein
MLFTRRSVLLAGAIRLCGQEPHFSTDVDVVTLFATVRDRDGRVIKTLERDDFTVFEDGKRQAIRYFTRESNLPLTVGLLVDTSRSQRRVLEPERKASYQFLDQVLREGTDRAFIASFDRAVDLLQDFTSSRKELAAALERLRIPDESATQIYEAIRATSENQMRPQQGRKALILLSDGVSFRDPSSIGTAIEFAQRADSIIYSVLYAGPGLRMLAGRRRRGLNLSIPRHSNGETVMQRLARETGGAYFEISEALPIGHAYADIEDALRNQYSIGYTPQRPGKSGEYRKIRLTVHQRGLIVQTRDGYYAK